MPVNGGGIPLLATANIVAIRVRDASVLVRIAREEGPCFASSEKCLDSKPSFFVGVVWHAFTFAYPRYANKVFVCVACTSFILCSHNTQDPSSDTALIIVALVPPSQNQGTKEGEAYQEGYLKFW